MPLAILRKQVKDLPAAFVLDDSLGMGGGPRLSQFKQVAVGARVSRSGNALPQPGDVQGAVQPVALGAGKVEVVVDQVVP